MKKRYKLVDEHGRYLIGTCWRCRKLFHHESYKANYGMCGLMACNDCKESKLICNIY